MGAQRRRTLAEEIAEEIKSLIKAGVLSPGQHFPTERELSQRFGASLSTVREAKKGLELMRLVRSYPGRGTFLTKNARSVLVLSESLGALQPSFRELYEARRLIEGNLAGLAAVRATPEHIKAMQEAIDLMDSLITGSTAGFVEADMAFHMAVADAASNTFLREMYRAIRELMVEVLRKVASYPGVKRRSLEFHKAAFEAIKNGRIAEAKRITVAHLRDVERLIESHGSSPRVSSSD